MAIRSDNIGERLKPPAIAIVDDDDGVRAAYGDLIRSHGLDARLYASSEEFLAVSDAELPDCIILDQRLPGLSGLELQQKLNEMNVEVPVIFVTSQDDPATRRRSLLGGAKFFFGKPVDDGDMMAKIFEVLEGAGVRNDRQD